MRVNVDLDNRKEEANKDKCHYDEKPGSHLKGSVLVMSEYIMGRTIKPWMKSPRITVVKYQPSCISTFPKSPMPSTCRREIQMTRKQVPPGRL